MMSLLRLHPIVFDEFPISDGGLLDATLTAASRKNQRTDNKKSPMIFLPGEDVEMSEKELRISLDIPGVKASDISLTVDNEMIKISGARRITNGEGKTVKKARFSKSFNVDVTTVDTAKLSANLSDGVLVVSAPRNEKPASRVITITTNPHPDRNEGDDESKSSEKNETLKEN